MGAMTALQAKPMPALQSNTGGSNQKFKSSPALQIYRAGSVHHRAKVITFHHFLFQKVTGHAFEDIAAVAQDSAGFVVGAGDELFHFLVDQARGFLRIRSEERRVGKEGRYEGAAV